MNFEPNSLSLGFVEELYEQYQADHDAVPLEWQQYFEQMKAGNGTSPAPQASAAVTPYPVLQTLKSLEAEFAYSSPEFQRASRRTAIQHRVDKLIRNIRMRGHIVARLDPLGKVNPDPPEINPFYYGLTEEDMDVPIHSERPTPDGKPLTVRKVITRMRNTYCRYIGIQFMHIDDMAVREWLQQRMELSENRVRLTREHQIRILTRLTDAIIFEEFIQKKYMGAKSFSLEGSESLIPLLDLAIEKAGSQGVEEILIGMPHRGRLNVLCNIMGKSPRRIFREFEDKDTENFIGRGDVKYHLGYHCDWILENGNPVNLALAFNPSHLEFVGPVVEGRMRARQDRENDPHGEHGLVILMHGDAAFAGEGIVQETLNLSELKGYATGGTLHIIVNNQVGFTTDPEDARSCTYATDVAKMLQVPIFHVNGEEPESVAQVVNIALDFRKTFHRDVVIDMYCYRKRGHNEGDEPSFTQPMLYNEIRKRQSVRDGYLQHLLKLGGVSLAEADEIAKNRREILEAELDIARSDAHIPSWDADQPVEKGRPQNPLREAWRHFHGGPESRADEVATALPAEQVRTVLLKLAEVPEGFRVHPKLERILENRREMAEGKRPLDWAAAELLALGSLALDGHPVRLSGEDCQRGTFSHRHAVLHDYRDGRTWMPLGHLSPDQARVQIVNSPLSEAGVLGFEYGYSVGMPQALTIWEAQFGDFSNVAQVIIDQFIASAEDKWKRLTGLVMLLPHGLEGTGPEHASARLERYLTLAADDNLQIAQPTTPANLFHMLRRQVLRRWRKPLIVMSPKSMLRNPQVASEFDAFTRGSFECILPDRLTDAAQVRRVLLCSGKIYYDLLNEREKSERTDIAILRMEQLYPINDARMAQALAPYAPGVPVTWVQEEPENNGAWRFMLARFGTRMLDLYPFTGVYRPASASPATGSSNAHKIEQERVVKQAFAD